MAAEEARRLTNLENKRDIIKKIVDLTEDIDNINLRFPEFKQLQADFKAIKEIPQSEENEVWKNFQAAVEQFYDRLKMNKELRDLDFKKNLGAEKTPYRGSEESCGGRGCRGRSSQASGFQGAVA